MTVKASVETDSRSATGRWGRVRVYLREMIPLPVIIPVGFLKFFAVFTLLQGLVGASPLVVTWRGCIGGLSLALMMILMRVYDELKDVESDIRLGRAGDPRYKDRAIVRGAVHVADVRALRNRVVGLLWILNIASASLPALAGFAITFAVLWLSSAWFFWPRISQSLALAFWTHNPLVLFMGGYIIAVFVGDFGVRGLSIGTVAVLLLAMWLPVAAWETSRKVRIPADETDYETYSKLLGWKTAALVPALLVSASCAATAYLAMLAGLPMWFYIVLVAAAAVPVLGCLRLRFAPSTPHSKLQPLTEAYAALSDLALLAALIAAHGVSIS